MLTDRAHSQDGEFLGRFTLELKAWHLVDGYVLGARLKRRPADEDVEGRGRAAEARGRVHCVSEGCVLQAILASHVSHHRRAGVDTDAPAYGRQAMLINFTRGGGPSCFPGHDPRCSECCRWRPGTSGRAR